MSPLASTLPILLAGTLAAYAELPVNWSTNYSAVLPVAGSESRPALVYFTASWCGPCKLMTRIILTDPVVMQSLSNVDHVAVDIDEHPDLAKAHDVEAVPTFILLSAGQEVDRATGFRPVDDFLEWLTNGVKEARSAALRLTLAKSDLAEADRLLAAQDTNSDRLAAAKLFDLCAERDTALVQAAAGRLKTLAARHPLAVLDGLNDSRLATRIQAANVLRASIGDAFGVDPWSDAATRLREVKAWRQKLAKPIGAGHGQPQ